MSTDRSCWWSTFSPETWEESRAEGFHTTGHSRPDIKGAKPGDLMICYITAPAHVFAGVLEITGPGYEYDPDDPGHHVWADDAKWLHRLPCRPLVVLEPEYGLNLEDIIDQVPSRRGPDGKFSGVKIQGQGSRKMSYQEGWALVRQLMPFGYQQLIRPVRHTRSCWRLAG